MKKRTLAVLLVTTVLCGCSGKVPDVDTSISQEAQMQGFPRLGPVDGILAEAKRPSRARQAGAALRARGADLTRRDIAPPAGVPLAERGRLLRLRADRLRAAAL